MKSKLISTHLLGTLLACSYFHEVSAANVPRLNLDRLNLGQGQSSQGGPNPVGNPFETPRNPDISTGQEENLRNPVIDFPLCAETRRGLSRSGKQNEDRILLKSDIGMQGGHQAKVFGVADGHGGYLVSDALSTEFLETLAKDLGKLPAPPKTPNRNYKWVNDIAMAISDAIYDFDEYLCTGDYSDQLLATGSTASFVVTIDDQVGFVVNIGDSRTIVLEDDKLLFGSVTHKPSKPSELEHIKSAGGSVTKFEGKTERVMGYFAVSRAFGDCDLKRNSTENPLHAITYSPEVYDPLGIMRVTPDIKIIEMDPKKEYMFMAATDGLDAFTPGQILQWMNIASKYNDEGFCKEIITIAEEKKVEDDVSLIAVKIESKSH